MYILSHVASSHDREPMLTFGLIDKKRKPLIKKPSDQPARSSKQQRFYHFYWQFKTPPKKEGETDSRQQTRDGQTDGRMDGDCAYDNCCCNSRKDRFIQCSAREVQLGEEKLRARSIGNRRKERKGGARKTFYGFWHSNDTRTTIEWVNVQHFPEFKIDCFDRQLKYYFVL